MREAAGRRSRATRSDTPERPGSGGIERRPVPEWRHRPAHASPGNDVQAPLCGPHGGTAFNLALLYLPSVSQSPHRTAHLPSGRWWTRDSARAMLVAKERPRCCPLAPTADRSTANGRSDERSVGKECASTCRYWWVRDHLKKKPSK